MANEQNLRPSEHKFSREECVKGAKASAEKRRKRKAFAEAFETLLTREFSDRNGQKLQGVEAVAAKVFQAAMDGDMKAIQFLRDTVGEAPVQRVAVAEISQETYQQVEDILMGGE
jgi:N-acetylglucosamine kinase-like BadF-type ATPase